MLCKKLFDNSSSFFCFFGIAKKNKGLLTITKNLDYKQYDKDNDFFGVPIILSVGIDQDLFGQQKSRIVEDDRDAGKLFIGNSCGLCESTVWTLEKKNLD